MIKLSGVCKTYNKNKKNSQQVLKNINIELPSKGLVTLLGHSGSGKTTLLNIISGLDKKDSGQIDIDLKGYKSFDQFRLQKIGYIFQNYLLLEDKTVFENLQICLELMGINDEEEQSKRIEYSLNAVGMYKFRKKKAINLSGGQMQRVSIARALLKNNELIIADEPTGNLDRTNTIEIMSILKKISTNTLVLLVTHNEDIAKFFSNRIIRIKDGAILSDEQNESTGTLDNFSEQKIYLMDLHKESLNSNLDLYTDKEELSSNIRIIFKNNTLYIDSNYKVVPINGSTISVVNDHYKKIDTNKFDTFSYDTSWYSDGRTKKRRFYKDLISSLRLLFSQTKKQKLYNIIFCLLGIFMAICAFNFIKYSFIDDSTFPNENVSVVLNIDDEYKAYEFIRDEDNVIKNAISEGYIKKIIYSNTYKSSKFLFYYNAIRAQAIKVETYIYPDTFIKNEEYYTGNEPNSGEVVLGKKYADYILEFLGKKYDYTNLIGKKIDDFIISGITKKDTYAVYITSKDYNYQLFDKNNFSFDSENFFSLYNYFTISYEDIYYNLVDGVMPEQDNEALAYKDSGLSIGEKIEVFGSDIRIVGRYEITKENSLPTPFINTDHSRLLLFSNKGNMLMQFSYEQMYYYNNPISFEITSDGEKYFKDNGLNVKSIFDYKYDNGLEQNKSRKDFIPALIIVLLIISVVYTYFTLRARMISDIKRIGIYRSIGASRRKIIQKNILDIVVNLTLTSIVSYLLTCVVFINVNRKIARLTDIAPSPHMELLWIGVLFIYLLNIIAGIITLATLLIKTPAEINSKYDI